VSAKRPPKRANPSRPPRARIIIRPNPLCPGGFLHCSLPNAGFRSAQRCAQRLDVGPRRGRRSGAVRPAVASTKALPMITPSAILPMARRALASRCRSRSPTAASLWLAAPRRRYESKRRRVPGPRSLHRAAIRYRRSRHRQPRCGRRARAASSARPRAEPPGPPRESRGERVQLFERNVGTIAPSGTGIARGRGKAGRAVLHDRVDVAEEQDRSVAAVARAARQPSAPSSVMPFARAVARPQRW